VNRLQIALEHKKLSNGLHVVVAPDSTAPVVTVGVYYKIGLRLEPQGRSGFAHLFEHMMFQGSANAPKMQHIKLINSSGGVLNGSTSYDVTNYYEAVPSNALERVLWLEADRMRALKVDDERWPIIDAKTLFERHRCAGDLKQSRRLFLSAGVSLKMCPKRCSGNEQYHSQLESFYRLKILHQSTSIGLPAKVFKQSD